MKRLTIIIAFLSTITCLGQGKLQYDYDLSGNRKLRKLVPNRVAHPVGSDSLGSNLKSNFGAVVFPNPVFSTLTISIDSLSIDEHAILQFSNELGVIVKEYIQKSNQLQIDLTYLSSGTYFLKIIFRKEDYTYKLLKI